jgi:hypothetical protein
MDNNIIILFYSKYSTNSLNLIKQMEQCLNFKKICIDNKDIRSTILNENDKYNITEVPCIFIFYSNGIIHKYEGYKAIEWVNQIANTMDQSKKLLPNDILTSPSLLQTSSDLITKNEPIILSPLNNDVSSTNNQPLNNINDLKNDLNDQFTDQEDSLIGMKRKIETAPLIQPHSSNQMNIKEENENKINIKFDKKNESILNIAQSLQAQREKEDESVHPKALSKLN